MFPHGIIQHAALVLEGHHVFLVVHRHIYNHMYIYIYMLNGVTVQGSCAACLIESKGSSFGSACFMQFRGASYESVSHPCFCAEEHKIQDCRS